MSWLRLDDEFAQHPKVGGLSDRAFRAHVTGMLYCSRFETDGSIPKKVMRAMAITPASVKELVGAKLWSDRNGSYWIKDYLEYNPSHADLEQKRSEAAERQARARERKRESQEKSQRDSQRDSIREFALSSLAPQPQPQPSTGSKVLGLSADVDPALETPDESEPVGRLLAVLPNRDRGTEPVLRSLVRQLPKSITEERALSYVRDEVVRTGAGAGRAVRILQRIVSEGELVTPGFVGDDG